MVEHISEMCAGLAQRHEEGDPAAERAVLRPVRPPAAMSSLPLSSDRPVAALGLPPRAVNALHGAGIRLLKDAADWSARDLLSLPQMGPATLAAIRAALGAAGLDLRPSARRRRL